MVAPDHRFRAPDRRAFVGLVGTKSVASFCVRLLPKMFAAVGGALVVTSVALIATDHGGVGLAMLPWLTVAGVLLLRAGASIRARA